MFNFSKLTTYDLQWQEAGREKLSAQDIEDIQEAKVEPANYGMSVCFYMKSGGRRFIQLSRDSKLGLGDTVDPSKGEVITLKRKGDEDKFRWIETF